MIASIITWLVARGVAPKLAKPLIIFVALCTVISAFALLKSCYDNSVIENHDAEISAETQRKAREADANAALQRKVDEARISEQEKDMHDAVAKTPDTMPDAARVALGCARLRNAGKDVSRIAACN